MDISVENYSSFNCIFIYIYVDVCLSCMPLNYTCTLVFKDQKREPDALEPESRTVVRCHIHAGNLNYVFRRESSTLNFCGACPAPQLRVLFE